MDWYQVIDRNEAALRRIVAALVSMARPGRATLPRVVHRAVLALLRPAEAAARRLIIVLARDIVVTPAPARARKPARAPTVLGNGVGTGILLPRRAAFGIAAPSATAPCLAMPMFDPLRRSSPARTARPDPAGVARIWAPGQARPPCGPPRLPPSLNDPVSTKRLRLRLDALGRALENLPARARRFASWRARCTAEPLLPQSRRRRNRRFWPLRGGLPCGARGPRSRRRAHEIDAVLHDLHCFALLALERHDSS